MKLYDIVNNYWKPLSFVVVCVVLVTQAHGRLEATELTVSENSERIELNEKQWRTFKEWLIRQEGKDDKDKMNYENIKGQLAEIAEQNKILLQFLLQREE